MRHERVGTNVAWS